MPRAQIQGNSSISCPAASGRHGTAGAGLVVASDGRVLISGRLGGRAARKVRGERGMGRR